MYLYSDVLSIATFIRYFSEGLTCACNGGSGCKGGGGRGGSAAAAAANGGGGGGGDDDGDDYDGNDNISYNNKQNCRYS
jgi:hypothetical protein